MVLFLLDLQYPAIPYPQLPYPSLCLDVFGSGRSRFLLFNFSFRTGYSYLIPSFRVFTSMTSHVHRTLLEGRRRGRGGREGIPSLLHSADPFDEERRKWKSEEWRIEMNLSLYRGRIGKWVDLQYSLNVASSNPISKHPIFLLSVLSLPKRMIH